MTIFRHFKEEFNLYNKYVDSCESFSDQQVHNQTNDNMFDCNTKKNKTNEKNILKSSKIFSDLSSIFGSNVKKPKLTLENIILIAVVYFIIADSDDCDIDLLIILALLWFIGI